MVTVERANYILNINLHILILFTFLTILFFAFISHLEQSSVDSALNNAINDQVSKLLTNLTNLEGKEIGDNINWEQINDWCDKTAKEYSGESKEITKNHRNLLILGIVMIVIIFSCFSAFSIYFGFYKGYEIHWKEILIENLVVFSFVGLIEFLFFTQIAIKYVPAAPDTLVNTILNRVKINLFEYINKNDQ